MRCWRVDPPDLVNRPDRRRTTPGVPSRLGSRQVLVESGDDTGYSGAHRRQGRLARLGPCGLRPVTPVCAPEDIGPHRRSAMNTTPKSMG